MDIVNQYVAEGLLLDKEDFQGKDTIYLITGWKLTEFSKKQYPKAALFVFLPIGNSEYISLVLEMTTNLKFKFMLDEKIFDEGEIIQLEQKYANRYEYGQISQDLPLDSFQAVAADVKYDGPKDNPDEITIFQMGNITLQPIVTIEKTEEGIYESALSNWNYRAVSTRGDNVTIP